MNRPYTPVGTLVDSILAANARDKAVDEILPGGGRVRLDHRRPFLCVYRRPADHADEGTDALLTGQAAFLISGNERGGARTFKSLLRGLVQQSSEAFGSTLIIEIWSAPASDEEMERQEFDDGVAPAIRLCAPSHDVPRRTLETMERALLEHKWSLGAPQIKASYCKMQRPPGLPPLLPCKQLRELGAAIIGIEISPFYRCVATGEPYPQVLNEVRRALGTALRKAFYTFSHTRATYRPAHYNELGSMAISDAVWKVDQGLAKIGDAFDLLLHVSPVNTGAAWREFRCQRCAKSPEFAYRPLTIKTSALKADLFNVPVRDIEDPALHNLMAEKQDELDRQLTLLSDRGTRRFLYGSLQLFGAPDEKLATLAKDIISSLPPHSRDDRASDYIDANAFADIARGEIEKYKKARPSFTASAEVRDDVPGLLVSKGKLIIGHRVQIARARIEATLHHEVGTHILTHQNGLAQPFQLMHTGFAQYEELQEGLAVFSEYLVGGLTRPRIRTLAGRVMAVASIADGADFVETFRLLHDEFGFGQQDAYTIATRVYRGGGYVKDAIYLRGLAQLLQHLQNGARLDDLLIGKFALHHTEFVEELTWRKILTPAAHIPRYLKSPDALERLKRARSGLSVLDLVEGDGR